MRMTKGVLLFSFVLFLFSFGIVAYMLSAATSGFTQNITRGSYSLFTVAEAHQTTTIVAIETVGRPSVIPTFWWFFGALILLAVAFMLLVIALAPALVRREVV